MLFIIKKHSLQVKKHYKKQFFFTTITFFYSNATTRNFALFTVNPPLIVHHIHHTITYNIEVLLNLFISLLNVIS